MSAILLTGSSRGIGAAAREALKKRGAKVIGHATRAIDANTVAADFTEPSAPQMLWEEALNRAGGEVDVLVNNAGLFNATPLESSDIEWLDGWEETLRINLTATAQLSRFAVRHWRERGVPGRIVHVASRAGYRGDSPAHWHYAAAKGGMLAMHKTIARGYAAERIVSFAITPGFTDTAMAGDYLESRGGEGLLRDIPLGRVAEPEEIARIIEFCSLDAPESMTGAVIDANGASYVR
ncbi:SDR family oxidoreductase [Altererythrobacter sp.]|uniref:SDR family NAD(P)-dependent oxidoreductase n=1 Tax=Altererythrobacter sp. TaxID=1872480 RepID=UPI001B23409D|nr:SDR family oxidoreductase [Altererythrobacter sp.]MBO6608172.1 SDR family oxidoreductase [Altererythrobacter sp.]MBO6641572.1 SDR family oxidoreductase [Altererythrobacter sp.]MBO6707729.1 SDR family oxidoreductase [Altererythrobacter sp.]MBO6946139.1 SDR family oxidoreductase [Altererythrobacter sp.]